jgi:transcriptional regulator with GAF, ATPase, and Fis domain
LPVTERSREESVALPELLGESPAWREVREGLRRIARSDLPVLLRGETGTGKELVARALHALSERAARPFVAHKRIRGRCSWTRSGTPARSCR